MTDREALVERIENALHGVLHGRFIPTFNEGAEALRLAAEAVLAVVEAEQGESQSVAEAHEAFLDNAIIVLRDGTPTINGDALESLIAAVERGAQGARDEARYMGLYEAALMVAGENRYSSSASLALLSRIVFELADDLPGTRAATPTQEAHADA